MSDNENKPSIDDILVQWFNDHGKRFRAGNRQDALNELIDIFVSYGYTRSNIESYRKQIMKCLVGPSSPRGSQGLRAWAAVCSNDLNFVLSSRFSPVKKPIEVVEVPFTPSTESFMEESTVVPAEVPILKEEDKSKDPEDPSYRNPLLLAPELDRSAFAGVTTTEIMSDEDYFATLKRENNER